MKFFIFFFFFFFLKASLTRSLELLCYSNSDEVRLGLGWFRLPPVKYLL